MSLTHGCGRPPFLTEFIDRRLPRGQHGPDLLAGEVDRLVQAHPESAQRPSTSVIRWSRAVSVVGRTPAVADSPPGTNSVEALVRATRCPEIEVQAAAAWGLMWDEVIEDHRPLLEELSASWPVEDAPWEVTRVRELLNAAEE